MEIHSVDEKGTSSPLVSSFYAREGKRLFDLVMASLGLVLISPLCAVLAVLVKLSSRGPAIYWQERVGRAGRIFRIAKFRTMYEDADKRGLAITSAGDRRITPLGRVLRRFKLDELPQLWNVLNGDMSLVGPRPEVPRYVLSYSSAQKQVLSVRPGITDLASILYRNEEKVLGSQGDPETYYEEALLPHKLKINLQYLGRISFLYDVSLVLRTLGCIFADGASSSQPEPQLAGDRSGTPGIPGSKQNQ